MDTLMQNPVLQGKIRFKHIWWLIPLLLFYLIYILVLAKEGYYGDEPRYFRQAKFLLQGAYTDPSDPEFLGGPGYPILLMPFVLFDASLTVVRLFNAFLMVGGVYFFYRTLSMYLNQKFAVLLSLFLGLYPFALPWLKLAYTECLALFLSTGFFYYFCRALQEEKFYNKNSLFASLFLGGFILTKVFFAQVTTVLIVASLGVFLIWRLRKAANVALIGVGAYLLCVPYLIHTYQLTGKMMYWSTAGGQILYFHASPHENEFGNWFSDYTIWNPEKISDSKAVKMDQLSDNHIDFYKTLPYNNGDSATVTFERDLMFRKKAKELLMEHPEAYLKNSIASFNRLFFEFPRSYRIQSLATVKYVWVNMFIVVISILLIYPAIIARRKIPLELWFLLFFLLTFMGGISLVHAWTRYLIPVLPIILFFIGFMLNRVIEIKISK